MNIIRLQINQVTALWDSIRYSIIEACYPGIVHDSEVLQSVLCRLIKEEMQCWCLYDDEQQIYGYVITSIDNDINSKILLIYSEYLHNGLPTKEDYIAVNDNIESFARANGCYKVVAFSKNPSAISIAQKMGYSADYTILMKEVV